MTLQRHLEDADHRRQLYQWSLDSANLLVEWIHARARFTDRLVFDVPADEIALARNLWFVARILLVEAAAVFRGGVEGDPELEAKMDQLIVDEAFSRHKSGTPVLLRERAEYLDHFFDYIETHGVSDG